MWRRLPAPEDSLPPLSGATAQPTPGVGASGAATPTAADPTATEPTATPGQFDATQGEAEAFVEEWWATLNAVLTGGAAGELRDMYLPSCDYCEQLQGEAVTYEREGTRAEGAEQRVVEVRYAANEGNVALVESVVEPQSGRLIDADGQVIRELDGGDPVRFVFNVVETDSGWRIQDLLNLGAA